MSPKKSKLAPLFKIPKKFARLVGWSPTRLSSYEQCPLQTVLKYGEKLCPCCHREQAIQAWDKPIVAPDGTKLPPNTAYCATAKKVLETPKPLANGIKLGGSIERYINGISDTLDKGLTHPIVLKIIEKLRAQYRAMGQTKKSQIVVAVEKPLVFNDKWEPISPFTRGAWLRTKLDVLRVTVKTGVAEDIDWKSGGIDKRTGQIRSGSKYDDQLSIYSTALLSDDPGLKRVESSLVFIEAPHKIDPVVAVENSDLTRKDLPAGQKRWSLRVIPFHNDETFAPRPGWYCSYCAFSKDKGGPCPVK